REAPPAQPTCSSGALWSVGCFGCANSRLSSVIAQKQMCAKYRTLPAVTGGKWQQPDQKADKTAVEDDIIHDVFFYKPITFLQSL
ncbi:hypothetical protein, partial [uncultured Victivallis sp.]|uniref:hypothetical protein n=1 Tax=uncultured Victivallis sp. TaxID=354118 RepID=UPI0025E721A4